MACQLCSGLSVCGQCDRCGDDCEVHADRSTERAGKVACERSKKAEREGGMLRYFALASSSSSPSCVLHVRIAVLPRFVCKDSSVGSTERPNVVIFSSQCRLSGGTISAVWPRACSQRVNQTVGRERKKAAIVLGLDSTCSQSTVRPVRDAGRFRRISKDSRCDTSCSILTSMCGGDVMASYVDLGCMGLRSLIHRW